MSLTQHPKPPTYMLPSENVSLTQHPKQAPTPSTMVSRVKKRKNVKKNIKVQQVSLTTMVSCVKKNVKMCKKM